MTQRADLRVVEGEGGEPVDPLVGRVIDGRYQLESVLGEGGMGLVYRARHTVLGKLLAIKVLRADVSRDEEIMTRFRQEAQSASSIGNQHIIDISDFGSLPNGSTYFVMEYLNGVELGRAVGPDKPMEVRRAIHIMAQLCDALGAAHHIGIVHRDLKPDNVYLIERGSNRDFVKVLDFGIAKVGGKTSKLTKAGQVFGTPHYMSPEQCSGTSVDHRTDIYALGVIMYEMVTGRVPFDADHLMGILTKHMYEAPTPPHTMLPEANIPEELEAVILKALSKDPNQRQQSMADLLEELTRVDAALGGGAIRMGRIDQTGSVPLETPAGIGSKNRLPLFIGGGVVLAAAIVGGLVLTRSPEAAQTSAQKTETVTPAAQTPEAPPKAAEPEALPAIPNGAVEKAAANEAPAAPTPIMLHSEPEGAEVWQAGELVGNTPISLKRPVEGERVDVELRLAGFKSTSLKISSITQDMVRLTLERSRGSSSSSRSKTAAKLEKTSAPAEKAPAKQPTKRAGGSSEVLDPWAE